MGLETLLDESAHGDRDAFATFYDRTVGRAWHLAAALTGDRTAAEDVVRRSYLEAWSTAPTYGRARARARQSPMVWLLGIVQDTARTDAAAAG